jgi:Cu(I)/Ag(I) efflux system membrane fusion protein
MNKNTTITLSIGITLGVLASIAIYVLFLSSTIHGTNTQVDKNEQSDAPLYWVAPMDPNFKRDKPGQSPMGMDLVPVYAQSNDNSATPSSPGTVSIDSVTIQNLGVKTANIQKVVPQQTIRTFGKVQFAQDNIVHVHPRVEGWVETLFVRTEGEFIEKGKPLYSLYSPDLVNAQEEYLIALQQNDKALINAAQRRLTALNAPDTLITTIANTREIQHSITFYAKQSGVVSALNIQEGFYVKPSTTMLAIASLDTVWVLADIFANDLAKVAVGQSANIQLDYLPAQVFEATIQYIYPSLDNTTRTGTARFVLPNPNFAIKPEMFANVLINTRFSGANSSQEILAVPLQAVIRTGEQNRVVLALGEGKYKSVEVTLGSKYDDVFEVVSGLDVGDEVVTSAQFLIDSESSISSDFLRMHPPQQNNETPQQSSEIISDWTHATVNEVMLNERRVNLTHGPLDAFNMMGMTMNFDVSDEIDIEEFEPGMQVHVEVVKNAAGMYEIVTVHFANDMNDMSDINQHSSDDKQTQHKGDQP